jgi:hypothetical protein
MKEDMALHLPLPCLLLSEINLWVGNKQRVVKEKTITWTYEATSYK